MQDARARSLGAVVLVAAMASSGCFTIAAKRRTGLAAAADLALGSGLLLEWTAANLRPEDAEGEKLARNLAWAGVPFIAVGLALGVGALMGWRTVSPETARVSDAVIAAAEQRRCDAVERLLEPLRTGDRAEYERVTAVESVQACVGTSGTGGRVAAAQPSHMYRESVGGELYGIAGHVGEYSAYSAFGAGARVHGDLVLSKGRRLGIQGHVGGDRIGEGGGGFRGYSNSLDIFDAGAALYRHAYCGRQLCVTPLAGLDLAVLHPVEQSGGGGEVFFALGVRGELGVDYGFGAEDGEVVSLKLGAELAQRPFGDTATYQLDSVGIRLYIGLGYAHRFAD